MNTSNGAKAGSTATDPARGMALLRDPLLNKGTAFTEQERDTLGLRGLLPAHVLSMEAQAGREHAPLKLASSGNSPIPPLFASCPALCRA